MPRKSQLLIETINQIRELYERGFGLLEISRKLGVQKWQILRYTEDMPRHVRRLTIEEKEEIRKMREQGYTNLEIAQKFKINPQTVYLIARGYGITQRFFRGYSLEVLSHLIENGYFIITEKNHKYLYTVRMLSVRFNIKKVTLSEGKNCITVCFLPDKGREALKAVLKLMKKKATSYQELSYLSQVFGIKLSASQKRNAVNTKIKDAV